MENIDKNNLPKHIAMIMISRVLQKQPFLSPL